jgi:putative tricarboxylic transport membrane protein
MLLATTAPQPDGHDVLAEIKAEVAHELEEDRPPDGGPI